MKKIGMINGPNLNLLGEREPDIYGNYKLKDIEKKMEDICLNHKVEIEAYQSNSEGEIIDLIHKLGKIADIIIINPGGYTHTSIAIKDAVSSISIPVIEVHISNIFNREDYRKISVTGQSCLGVITGFGVNGYFIALEGAIKYLIS